MTSFVFNDEQLTALGDRGLVVVDNVAGAVAAGAAADAVNDLVDAGVLSAAGVSRNGQHVAQIRGDKTVFLDEDDITAGLVDVVDALKAIQRALREQAWLTVPRREFQLACYDGDSIGYARHRDAFRGGHGVTGHRRVTVVYYMNPGWMPAHGGALRCFTGDDGSFVDVEPVLDRTVIFMSEQIEHAVLPSTHRRCALTLWLSPA